MRCKLQARLASSDETVVALGVVNCFRFFCRWRINLLFRNGTTLVAPRDGINVVFPLNSLRFFGALCHLHIALESLAIESSAPS